MSAVYDMLSKSRVVEILPYKHGRKVRVIHHTDPIQQTSNTAKIVQITPGTGGDSPRRADARLGSAHARND